MKKEWGKRAAAAVAFAAAAAVAFAAAVVAVWLQKKGREGESFGNLDEERERERFYQMR